jgi:hypothetical protein
VEIFVFAQFLQLHRLQELHIQHNELL